MSYAPGDRMPSRVATWAAALGIWLGIVQVATSTRSMSDAPRPLAASALPPAVTAMSTLDSSGPATRRLAMPTRLRIHSSLVSICRARSSLVTTRAGWCSPRARIRAPGAPVLRPHRASCSPVPGTSRASGSPASTRSPSCNSHSTITPS